MKKIILSIVAVVMLACMVACGSSSGGDVQNPSNVSGNTVNEEVTITETVLVDEAGVKITAKSLDLDSIWGAELKLLIENNSDKNLTFQCRNSSVNGYMTETSLSEEVVSGKKANATLIIMDSNFEVCGIDAIADMEFSFHIFDTVSWDRYLDTAPIQIKTSIADQYEYKFDDSGSLAYEGNGVKIVVRGLNTDGFFGPAVIIYAENNSDKNITIQSRDVSVNGFMIDPMFSCDVVKGKKAIDVMSFFESDIEENDITEIENIELSFHIFDMDDWDGIKDTDTIVIEF